MHRTSHGACEQLMTGEAYPGRLSTDARLLATAMQLDGSLTPAWLEESRGAWGHITKFIENRACELTREGGPL
jgi:hypothetical protein